MASPITSVTPCTVDGVSSGTAVTNLTTPSVYEYNLHDVSDSQAGRLESMKMIKMRKGQATSIRLEWAYPTLAEAADILTAFNSEYVKVNCLQALTGTYAEKVYYVGDRIAPLWNSARGRWERVGFTIIQQEAD